MTFFHLDVFKCIFCFCSFVCVFVLLFGYVFVLFKMHLCLLVFFGALHSFCAFYACKIIKKIFLNCLFVFLVPCILFVLFVRVKFYHKKKIIKSLKLPHSYYYCCSKCFSLIFLFQDCQKLIFCNTYLVEQLYYGAFYIQLNQFLTCTS